MVILRKTSWIMLGVAGSGKSTWIKENLGNNVLVISKDGIREELGIIKGNKKAIGTKEQEKKVQEIHNQRIKDAIREGKSFVLDNTNLGRDLKGRVGELKRAGYKVIGVRINTPIDVCIKRRPEIPEEHLRNMDRKLKEIDTTIFDKLVEA